MGDNNIVKSKESDLFVPIALQNPNVLFLVFVVINNFQCAIVQLEIRDTVLEIGLRFYPMVMKL